jgi:CSLREA domain-containing protein
VRIDYFFSEAKRTRKALALGYGLAMIFALLSLFSLQVTKPARAAATFTVNSTGDAGDDNPGNGSCFTGVLIPGSGFGLAKECTLRAAIEEANANDNDERVVDAINFGIPEAGPHTISPARALPDITEPVTIDGYTEPGASVNTATTGTNAVLQIVLNGSNAPDTAAGLRMTAGSTVKGLVINGFNTGVILFPDGGQQGEGNRLEGSFIGTDASGTTAVSNGIGVLASGFATGSNPSESKNEVVGGDTLAARNLISGNITGVDTFFGRATVEGNLIGTKKDGTTTLGNGLSGVVVTGPGNIIVSNTIAHSGFDGVEVSGDDGTGNRILSNSIFDNGLLGIDLRGSDGPSANDTSDGDAGPNNQQNYPVITDATTVGTVTTIEGTLNSIPSSVTTQTFTIQFFSSPAVDPSGFGEGRTFLGETQVETDAIGNASFTFVPAQKVPVGQFITATATNNATGDTSEFSQANDVEPPVAQP